MTPTTTTRPDYAEALRRILDAVTPLEGVETVALDGAVGRVLAEPVVADRDLPPFDRAQMDGYALRGAEVGQVESWPVVATIAAGQPADIDVPPGRCVAIATGAPLPGDVDTVIQHELSDCGDPVRFTVDHVEVGRSVHPRGADARRGDRLVEPATILRPHHVGIAAMAGATPLAVRRRPRVTIISSGDEIRPVDERPLEHQIRNSNGPMLAGLLQRMGAAEPRQTHVIDEPAPTRAAVGAAIDEVDLLVTIGGVSAGRRDHLPDAFEAAGVQTVLHRASIQPGGPIYAGRHPAGTVVIGLPGNPVSVLACCCLFAWPVVRRLLGVDPALPWRSATLATPVRPNARRRAFRPCVIDAENRATVPGWAGSGDLAHTAATDGLVELPVQADEVAAGTSLRFLPWP